MNHSLYLPYSPVDEYHIHYLQHLTQIVGIDISYTEPHSETYLTWQENQIVLMKRNSKTQVTADFISGKLKHRTKHNMGEMIVKATHLNHGKLIWDATAGLGKDAFVLASFGANVHLFEHHPIAAILLLDGLNRAKQSEYYPEALDRMFFHFGSITEYVQQNHDLDLPDTVYLDPMFPIRQKSASVKKEMALFQDVIGYNNDEADLLDAAKHIAKNYVVVKRPKQAPYLNCLSPNHNFIGKNIRFDVYLPYQKT